MFFKLCEVTASGNLGGIWSRSLMTLALGYGKRWGSVSFGTQRLPPTTVPSLNNASQLLPVPPLLSTLPSPHSRSCFPPLTGPGALKFPLLKIWQDVLCCSHSCLRKLVAIQGDWFWFLLEFHIPGQGEKVSNHLMVKCRVCQVPWGHTQVTNQRSAPSEKHH